MICLEFFGTFLGVAVSQEAGLGGNWNLKDFQLELVATNQHLTFPGSAYGSSMTKKGPEALRQDDGGSIPRSSDPDASPCMCLS